MALANQVLQEEAPDLIEKLMERGAQRVELRHDAVYHNLLMRRQLFESVLRSVLLSEPNVRMLEGVSVNDLIINRDQPQEIPKVVGVKTSLGDNYADLVIDAGGRRSPVPRWLTANGIALDIVDDPTTFIYLTRHYKLKSGEIFPSVRVPIMVALDYATVLAFPEDNGHFQLTVQLDCQDPTKRDLRNSAVFDEFLHQLPSFSPWLSVSDAISDVEVYGSAGKMRKRTFDKKPLVVGLFMVGDACVHTNPTAGRGMSLAMAHAQLLARLLETERENLKNHIILCEKWDQYTTALFEPWLKSQMHIDRERREQIRSSIEGKFWQRPNDAANRLTSSLAVVDDCEMISAARDKLFNMLVKPNEIFENRDLMRELFRRIKLDSNETLKNGPSREEYECFIEGWRHV